MKILKDEQFAAIRAQADAFVAVQTAMVEASEDLNAEDITADTVIEAMQNTDASEALTALQSQVDTANEQLSQRDTELETANSRITELEAELAELDATPAKKPARVTPKGDGGEPQSLADFANKNKGDTEAILAQAKKEGLI